jgi:hypothetical protein
MSYSTDNMKTQLAIADAIQKAIQAIELPQGFVITSSQCTILYKPQTLITSVVYLNRTPKGEYDTHMDLQ